MSYVLLRIHLDEKKSFPAMPSSSKLVSVQGMGVKNQSTFKEAIDFKKCRIAQPNNLRIWKTISQVLLVCLVPRTILERLATLFCISKL